LLSPAFLSHCFTDKVSCQAVPLGLAAGKAHLRYLRRFRAMLEALDSGKPIVD